MADQDSTRRPKNFIDLTGERFYCLVVSGIAPRDPSIKSRSARWDCDCDCGGKITVSSAALRRASRGVPSTKSCGCLNREQHTKHGQATKNGHTAEYCAWVAAKHRCINPKNQAYKNYGARGVVMCEGWIDDFAAFFREMGPSGGLELDRKDNDGNYSCGKCSQCVENGWPMNCRWATRKEQSNNRRVNRLVTHLGETRTIKQWSEKTGISPTALRRRIGRRSVEKVFSDPARTNRFLTFNGEVRTMKEWAVKLGINYSTLRSRINRDHWPIEKALAQPLRLQSTAKEWP